MKNRPLAQNNITRIRESLPISKSFDGEQYIYEKFKWEGFESLTEVQQKSIPVIGRKINTLVIAPTGSGKTEAAMMPILALLSNMRNAAHCPDSKSIGIRAIYVTPLRALNNDVFRRIIKYAESEHLKVQIRHGDTTSKDKRKITDCPPDVLITTPESLAIILVNEKILDHLKNLQWVIIDEVHEILSSERGAHLSVSLERLEVASSYAITRVGMSASIGNIREAARFLAGSERKSAIIVDKSIRAYDIEVKFIKGSINSVVTFILDYVRINYANSNRNDASILLFTNTRDEAEYIGTVLRNNDLIHVDVHHGSLSREMREETEQKLRRGGAGIVVCTSSLELGLDLGSVDLVIHYGSPRQVTKLLQRIGRSRHKQNLSAKGLIITNIPDDEAEALAIIRLVKSGSVEEQRLHNGALDVLAHHIVGLCLQSKNEVKIDFAFGIIRKAYPFIRTTIDDFLGCIELLGTNQIIRYNMKDHSYKRMRKAYKYYFENISTIPTVLKFEVIDCVNKRRIGTLDQQFVGDYGEHGNVFVLKGSQWRIVSIDEKRMILNVEPLQVGSLNVPYWIGEMIPIDPLTAQHVGQIRQESLMKKILTDDTVRKIHEELQVIPGANRIVIERSVRMNALVIHSLFGTKVNNSLASLLSTLLSSQLGYSVEAKSDAYRIFITSTARINEAHIRKIFIDEYNVEDVIIASLTGTPNINWKVWSVAKKFGVVSREAIYDKKVARMIYDRYFNTVLTRESIREIIHDKFDFQLTKQIIMNIRKGDITFHWREVDEFSDLARPITEHTARFSSTPLSTESGVIELMKERLEKTKHRLICMRCGNWERIMETREVPESIVCPRCKSRLIGATFWSDNALSQTISMRIKGLKLSSEENKRFERVWKTASLINSFGTTAFRVLAGHGIGADTAARILRDYVNDDEMYKSIYQAERSYVMTRGFWAD
ncbi:MAG: DEAD/DEAH box helicase [Nitrososphaeraceae archaeon]